MTPFADLREAVYETTLRLAEANLIRLSAGNISLRDDAGHIAITPSGVKYVDMAPADIVIIDAEGRVLDGKPGLKPSSEYQLHTILMQDLPGVQAMVHTHSLYALTFAALNRSIPMISLELLPAGGEIPVAPYVCPGTAGVGTGAAAVFRQHPGLMGLLLQNHGLVAVGPTLDRAYEYAYDIEVAAQVYHLALQVGQPVVLTDGQIEEMRHNYGMKKPS